jgi:hypothetical protein
MKIARSFPCQYQFSFLKIKNTEESSLKSVFLPKKSQIYSKMPIGWPKNGKMTQKKFGEPFRPQRRAFMAPLS